MRGVSRFDFYIDKWIGGTRGMSAEAKGVYIDLLCAIYSDGGPIPYVKGEPSERDLLDKCGLRRVDVLRRILAELVLKKKIRIADGLLFNGRAHEELRKIAKRRGDESEATPAEKSEKSPDKVGIKSDFSGGSIQPNQEDATTHATGVRESEESVSKSSKRVTGLLSLAARAPEGPNRADPVVRKQIWETRILTHLRATRPLDEYAAIADGYARGEPAAKRVFNAVDQQLRQRRAA